MSEFKIDPADIDRVIEVWQTFQAKLLELGQVITEMVQEVAEWLAEVFGEVWPTICRMRLYFRLRDWWVPDRVACWLAWHWPKGWLPGWRL